MIHGAKRDPMTIARMMYHCIATTTWSHPLLVVVVMTIGDPRFRVAISRFYMACIAIAMTMANLHLDIPQILGSFG